MAEIHCAADGHKCSRQDCDESADCWMIDQRCKLVEDRSPQTSVDVDTDGIAWGCFWIAAALIITAILKYAP